MRKIISTVFVTLDGIVQAPGGPEEDRSNNFAWGGWVVHYWDGTMGNVMGGFMSHPFDLLLGRRTYDIFAGYWPRVQNDPIADKFNATTKYVVSSQPLDLSWRNSMLITGDVVTGLKKLKQQNGNDLWVHGSGKLIQTLLANNLLDCLHVWSFPVTIGGQGKRLFAEGTRPQGLKLTNSTISTTGVIIASYEPAGELRTGTIPSKIEEPAVADQGRS